MKEVELDSTCYMCEDVAVSDEHCPPQNIFPSDKRIGLIKVPSCAKHNNDKTGIDEYLRDVFAVSYRTSKHAPSQAVTKFLNSLKSDKKKSGRFFGETFSMQAGDMPTLGFTLNKESLGYSAECIFRGLYFHESQRQKKLIGSVLTLFPDIDKIDPSLETQLLEAANIELWKEFSLIPFKGKYRELFQYRFVENPIRVHCQMFFFGVFSVYGVCETS